MHLRICICHIFINELLLKNFVPCHQDVAPMELMKPGTAISATKIPLLWSYENLVLHFLLPRLRSYGATKISFCIFCYQDYAPTELRKSRSAFSATEIPLRRSYENLVLHFLLPRFRAYGAKKKTVLLFLLPRVCSCGANKIYY